MKYYCMQRTGFVVVMALFILTAGAQPPAVLRKRLQADVAVRERLLINEGWKFMRYTGGTDKLVYDVRPEVTDRNDNIVADSKSTESVAVAASNQVLKPWILPSANDFIIWLTKVGPVHVGQWGTFIISHSLFTIYY